jgi:hypothetical protein
MLCQTIKVDTECFFMGKQGCSFNGGTCYPVVESCQGCGKADRTQEAGCKPVPRLVRPFADGFAVSQLFCFSSLTPDPPPAEHLKRSFLNPASSRAGVSACQSIDHQTSIQYPASSTLHLRYDLT